ncbi:hypothetical protein McPS_08540 [Marichromatium sp. PS1]
MRLAAAHAFQTPPTVTPARPDGGRVSVSGPDVGRGSVGVSGAGLSSGPSRPERAAEPIVSGAPRFRRRAQDRQTRQSMGCRDDPAWPGIAAHMLSGVRLARTDRGPRALIMVTGPEPGPGRYGAEYDDDGGPRRSDLAGW